MAATTAKLQYWSLVDTDHRRFDPLRSQILWGPVWSCPYAFSIRPAYAQWRRCTVQDSTQSRTMQCLLNNIVQEFIL